jgi:1,4-dihydroxy-2-naphthoate octaprenyltransferase
VATPKQQRIDPNKVASLSDKTKASALSNDPDARRNGNRSGRPGGRPPGAPKIRKATARDWIAGARLRTLPLSIAPVVLGTACAHIELAEWKWLIIALALVVSIALQIGVNYANDYSDGIRGTDKYRVGPARLTGSGAAKPRTVLTVALVFFAMAAIAGVILTIEVAQYWLLAVGAVCIVAAYFYTGGKRPYGYYGLGELVVFVFFGLVATAGTTFVQLGTVNFSSWVCGVAIGLIACAVLMVNNIRDREQDKVSGKRTLAVLLGDRASRIVFVVFLLLPFVLVAWFTLIEDNAYYTWFLLLIALPASLITLTGTTAKEFILALQLTSLTALLYAIVLGWSIAF